MFDAKCIAKIAKMATRFDIEPEALQAIARVESGGRVFATINGKKEPLIRFEGHYFDRLLTGKQRPAARRHKLSHPKAGKIRNPKSQKDRWKLLHQAIAMNRVAALSSTSWGLGQVMGAHWKWLGYGSVDALVAEARKGADGQVSLMARYIDKAGLIPAIRAGDWKTFAHGYNGPAYARYGYDVRIKQAYEELTRGKRSSSKVVSTSRREPESPSEKSSGSGSLNNILTAAETRIRKAIRAGLLFISRRFD